MEDTIFLLRGVGEIWFGFDLDKADIEKLVGDTIWGIDNCSYEIKRWSIDQIEEAKEELAKYRCSYRVMNSFAGKTIDAEEYALEYGTYDEDDDCLYDVSYDLAEIEWIDKWIISDDDFSFNKVEKALLKSVTICDDVTEIPDYAFEGCDKLTNVTIPDNVKEIGAWAFYGCKSLTDITIPDSVTSIGKWAFTRCGKLTISCSKGSCAEQYAKSNNISVTIVPKSEQATLAPDKAEYAAKKKPHHL